MTCGIVEFRERARLENRQSLEAKAGKAAYNGWTIGLTIAFLFAIALRHTPLRFCVKHTVDRDRRFLAIIRSRKEKIKSLWIKYEKLFFLDEENMGHLGHYDPDVSKMKDAAKREAKDLVNQTIGELATAGWAYETIRAKVYGYPRWITVKACVNVWDEVEEFLLSRIRRLE